MNTRTFPDIPVGVLTLCTSDDGVIFEGYFRFTNFQGRNKANFYGGITISGTYEDILEGYTALPFMYDKGRDTVLLPGEPFKKPTIDDFLWVIHPYPAQLRRDVEKREFDDYEIPFFQYLLDHIVQERALGMAFDRLKKVVPRYIKTKKNCVNMSMRNTRGVPQDLLDQVDFENPDSPSLYKAFFKEIVKPEQWGQERYDRTPPKQYNGMPETSITVGDSMLSIRHRIS